MANSLTNLGEEMMLHGNTDGADTDGGFTRLATKVKLYRDTSTPNKDGTGFTEVANGFGYTTGGQALTTADWTCSVVSQTGRIVMDDKNWTAAGGDIEDVAGAMITNAADAVLAWWERAPVTVGDGDTITLTSLTIIL